MDYSQTFADVLLLATKTALKRLNASGKCIPEPLVKGAAFGIV